MPEARSHKSTFFWKGRIGHGFEALTREHVEKLWAACGETARAFGYDFNGEELIVNDVPAIRNVERRTHRFPAVMAAHEETAAPPAE